LDKGVSHEQKKTIIYFIKKYFPNSKIFFFGSRHRGDHKKYSDLDLCIQEQAALDLIVLSKLKEELSQSNLPFQVDLSDWHRITPEFQKLIKANSEEWCI